MIKNFNKNTFINKGIDGEVHYYDNDKVIKITNEFDIKISDFLIKNDIKEFVKVYDVYKEDDKYHIVMEKCEEITDDEWKVFHTLLSHEDLNKVKNYSIKQINKILKGLELGLDFDKNKVLLFCEGIKKIESKIKHLDIHPRNIMKKNGYFKFIDLNRVCCDWT